MLTFIITCILIELTPGPNMAYLAILTINSGKRAGFATVAGVAVGLFCVALAAAFGMAELISIYPVLYEMIRWAGVLYLLWLAFDTWKAKPTDINISEATADHFFRHFQQGFLVNVLNPKAAVFYLSVIPKFLDLSGNIMAQTLVLVLISVGIATVIHLLIVLFASRLRPVIHNGNYQQRINRVFAVLLVAVAAWFGATTHR